jgi:hypothetical protein
MAILRGGRRIGNFDIRLGLPRDKSLVDVAGDPRLQRTQAGSGTIQRFLSQINVGEGFARTNRYIVRINPPSKIETNNNKVPPSERYQGVANNELEGTQVIENVDMMCSKVTLPNRDINTQPHIMYGPKREMPYAYSFSSNVECTFYGDKFLRQRLFFENWQKKIIDINSHNLDYYDNYVGSMDIMQLGQFDSKQDDDARVTYAVRLYEVYPQTIGSMDLSYGADNEIASVPVTLNFRTWQNLTIDQINGATVGKPNAGVPEIKASKDFGLFSGILGKLPPEFQRAGRDVAQAVTRNFPIGKISGGRLYPPYG